MSKRTISRKQKKNFTEKEYDIYKHVKILKKHCVKDEYKHCYELLFFIYQNYKKVNIFKMMMIYFVHFYLLVWASYPVMFRVYLSWL